jgi:hypothetical protein
MSSTNRGRLSAVATPDCSQLPANPQFQQLRFTSSDLAYTKQTTQSDELDASGMTADVPEVGASSGGSINIEWSAETYDDFIAAALRGTWGPESNATGAHVIAAGSRGLEATGAFANASPGMWILLGGFVANESYPGAGDSPNNGWWEIESVTDADNVVLKDPAGKLVNETAPATATVGGKCLINGTVERCFALSEEFLDTQSFLLFMSQRIGMMSMSLATGSIATGSFSFMGSDIVDEQADINFQGAVGVVAATRTISMPGAAITASPGQRVMVSGMSNAGNNGEFVIESVTPSSVVVTAASAPNLADETGPATARVVASAPSWSGPGAYLPATTSPALNATSNVGDIFIDGKLSTGCFQALDLNVDNNLRETPCIGQKFPRVDYGKQDITGSLTKTFVDLEIWRAMKDHQDISLSFGFISPDKKHGIHVFLPRVTLSSDQVDLSGGNNSDVTDNIDWTALRYTDPVTGVAYQIQVCVA